MNHYIKFALAAILMAMTALAATCGPLRVSKPGDGAITDITPEEGERLEREWAEQHGK